MSILLFGGWLRIRGKRTRWRRMVIGNREIMISHRTGPAVVGFVRPGIVLPEWALQFGKARRDLVLLHEEEHLRAHDERLLLLASITLIPMPWNVALWYQLRRLRLAVEIDCDARVLRVHPNAREYGDLLLDVGRRVNSGALQMAALSEPVSFLARRVTAMMAVRRQSRAAALLTLVIAVTAAAIACQAPRPPVPRLTTNLRPVNASVPVESDSPGRTVIWDGERITRDSLLPRLYGKTLSVTEPATLEFVVDANDVVVSAGVRASPSVYRSADSTVIVSRLPNGYSSVAPADIASIEIDRSPQPLPEDIGVIWVRLKPGANVQLGQYQPPARHVRRETAVGQTRPANPIDSTSDIWRTHEQLAISQADEATLGERLARQLALQLAWHETEAARFQAEMARHATEVAKLRAQLVEVDTQAASLGRELRRTRGVAGRPPSPWSVPFPRESILAAARRYYPDLVRDPPATPISLWFLADSADRVLETRLVRSPLGTVGELQVLNAFPGVARERIQSWTVTSPVPFGMVWVRVHP